MDNKAVWEDIAQMLCERRLAGARRAAAITNGNRFRLD
jgi:hypothetical protein